MVIGSHFEADHGHGLSVIPAFPFPGPRLFLSCPIDVDGSRVWFTDLWNYSIIPYLLEAVREGLQVSRQKFVGFEGIHSKANTASDKTALTAMFSLHTERLRVCDSET